MSPLDVADCCSGITSVFDDALAKKNLDDYRRRGPRGATRRLLSALRDARQPAGTLLDIGGGVGVLAHELLESGAPSAVLVDASPAYLVAAREESERRATNDRLRLVEGDLTGIADDVPAADVVTLDKVVCCYADLDTLLALSAARARRLCGLTYPRENWWVRLAVAVENRSFRRKGSTFRSYIHPERSIDSALRARGLQLRSRRRGWWWVVAVFERTSD